MPHELRHLTTLDDARRILHEALPARIREGRFGGRDVPITEAVDFALDEDIVCPTELPPFDRSTMDGYAVRAADIFGASEGLPAYLKIVGHVRMGEAPGFSLSHQQAAAIPTGGMLPASADAVVMVEHTQPWGSDSIEVLRPVAPGENIVRRGDDVRAGDVLLSSGHRLRPHDISALAGLGIATVRVRRPRVAVLSTGSELVAHDQPIAAGQIRDMNGPALQAAASAVGAEPVALGLVSDHSEAIRVALQKGLAEADIVLVSGGTSVGMEDVIHDLIDSLGPPGVLVHGLAMKPGKPVVIGIVNETPVFGMPGHPTSCLVIFREARRAAAESGADGASCPSSGESAPHPQLRLPGRARGTRTRPRRAERRPVGSDPVAGSVGVHLDTRRSRRPRPNPRRGRRAVRGRRGRCGAVRMSDSTEQVRGRRRDIYLSSIPLEDALALWRKACESIHLAALLGVDTVRTEDALGRVTFGPIFAAASSPHYHAAAMDGIAIHAADTAQASQVSPTRLRTGIDAIYVNTGDPLPADTDAVIMIEDVVEVEPGVLEIVAAAAPWQHTRVIGEDVVATDVVVPARQRLGPADIGALLAASVTEVTVVSSPRVAIIPTGGEIVQPGEASRPGEIPDFNSPMIAARLSEFGASVTRFPPVGDDPAAIQRAIESAGQEFDLVLTLAGASAGARDYTAEAIRRRGRTARARSRYPTGQAGRARHHRREAGDRSPRLPGLCDALLRSVRGSDGLSHAGGTHAAAPAG